MHVNCPHCQNPIEIVDRGTPEEVLCPSCGSSFKLEGAATTGLTQRDGLRDLGKFQLLDIVGNGAFGTVYKAKDPELDRIVAIKVPRGPAISPARSIAIVFCAKRAASPSSGILPSFRCTM